MDECTNCKNLFYFNDDHPPCPSEYCAAKYCESCYDSFMEVVNCSSCDTYLYFKCATCVYPRTNRKLCGKCIRECGVCGVQQRADLSKKMPYVYDELRGYMYVHKECQSALL